MKELSPIDNHRLFQEGPLLVFESHGDFLLKQAVRVTAVYSEIIKQHGYLLLLLDMSHSGKTDPRTRRHMADWGGQHADRLCIAAVSSNVVFRTMFTLVITAMRMLGGRQPETSFFAERAQAMAWLAAQGASFVSRYAAKAANPPEESPTLKA